MTSISTDLRDLPSRTSKVVPLLDDPPLGHLQAIVLKVLDDLGPDAFGYNALETLSRICGTRLDHAQVYSSIRKLLKRTEKIDNLEVPVPFLQLVGTRKSSDGGPPIKIYKLTPAGRAALETTAHHHAAVAAYLNRS